MKLQTQKHQKLQNQTMKKKNAITEEKNYVT